VRLAIPTGGEVKFVWDTASTRENDVGRRVDAGHGRGWQIELAQPLLRGGGLGRGPGGARHGRLADRQRALALGESLIAW